MSTTAPITFPISTPGADTSARQMEKLRTSMKGTEDQYQKLNRAGTGAAASFSAIGGALAKLDPQLGQFGSAIGRAGGAISGMASIIAGPWGLALGAAVAAVGLLTQYLEANTKAAEENQKKLKEAAELQVQLNAENFSRIQREQDQRRSLVASGMLGGPTSTEARNAQGLTARQQRELEALNQAEAQAGVLGMGPGQAPSGGSRSDAEFEALQRRQALQRQLRALNTAQAESEDRLRRFSPGQTSTQNRLDEEVKAENKARDEKMRNLDRLNEAQEEAARRSVESSNMMRDAGISAFSQIGTTGITALSKIAQGYKITGKQLLAAIGDILVAEGTRYLFQGAAMGIISAGLNPQAEALIALGSAEIAAGIGLGAASRSSAPGGRGGGSRSSFVPSTPEQRQVQGGTTIVNLNYSTQLAPSAQDGARAYAGIQRAQQQGLIPPSR